MPEFKYSISLVWSDEDEGYIATSQEFPGLSAFADNAEEAVEEAKIAIKMFIDDMKESGEELPKPRINKQYSGQFRLRLMKSLHKNLAIEAELENVSLNTYILGLLAQRHEENRLCKEFSKVRDHIKSALSLTGSQSVPLKYTIGQSEFRLTGDSVEKRVH